MRGTSLLPLLLLISGCLDGPARVHNWFLKKADRIANKIVYQPENAFICYRNYLKLYTTLKNTREVAARTKEPWDYSIVSKEVDQEVEKFLTANSSIFRNGDAALGDNALKVVNEEKANIPGLMSLLPSPFSLCEKRVKSLTDPCIRFYEKNPSDYWSCLYMAEEIYYNISTIESSLSRLLTKEEYPMVKAIAESNVLDIMYGRKKVDEMSELVKDFTRPVFDALDHERIKPLFENPLLRKSSGSHPVLLSLRYKKFDQAKVFLKKGYRSPSVREILPLIDKENFDEITSFINEVFSPEGRKMIIKGARAKGIGLLKELEKSISPEN